MANIKLLQLYRNSTIADSLEAAKSLMAEKAQGKDGEILICRYKDGDTPTTLVGVNNVMTDGKFLTYIESVSMTDVESTVQSAITTALAGLTGGGPGTEGQFVTEVTESEGVITVTYGAITSDGTIVITNGSGEKAGNINLGVNIDETTIVLNSEGKLSVSASAGGGYAGKDAISINDKEISLTIAENEQILSQSESGLKTTLQINYDSNTKYIQLLGITKEGEEQPTVISSFDASEFIVDGMITNAELVDYNPDTEKSGEFIAITFNTEGGETTTIYIDVSELIDTYTAGNGLALSDHEFSVKIADSETYLTVTESGLATTGIDSAISTAVATETTRAEAAEAELQAAIEAAVAGESTTVVEQGSSNTHVTVSSSKEEGSTTTTYTINESDIASATTQSNIISAVGLDENGGLTDDQKTAIGAENLVTAVTNLLAEVKADEVKLTIVSGDESITVTENSEGKTDISVTLSAVENSDYATDMIAKDTDGGLALNPVWDCGFYAED